MRLWNIIDTIVLILLGIVVLFTGSAIRGWLDARDFEQQHPIKCVTGSVLIPNEEWQTMVAIGEQQFCGRDLHWSGIYGPSIEEWRKGQSPLDSRKQ